MYHESCGFHGDRYLEPSQLHLSQVSVECPGRTQMPCEVLSWADGVGMCRFYFLFLLLQGVTSNIFLKSKIKIKWKLRLFSGSMSMLAFPRSWDFSKTEQRMRSTRLLFLSHRCLLPASAFRVVRQMPWTGQEADCAHHDVLKARLQLKAMIHKDHPRNLKTSRCFRPLPPTITSGRSRCF